MNIRLNLSVFFKEALLFSVTMVAGLFTAFQARNMPTDSLAIQPISYSGTDILTMLVFFILFTTVIFRFRRAGGIVLRVFFIIVVLFGSQAVFESFLAFPHSLILSLFVVVSLIGGPSIFVHDVAVALGIAGLSALLGLSLTPAAGAILLGILSIYDIIAVYRTRHMVVLADHMVASGAVFGFLIPTAWTGFFKSAREARPGQEVMILGSGDIGLPIAFASSLMPTSVSGAIFVACFSVVGLFCTHLIFSNQQERRPMAALPPIATLSILGYLVWILLRF